MCCLKCIDAAFSRRLSSPEDYVLFSAAVCIGNFLKMLPYNRRPRPKHFAAYHHFTVLTFSLRKSVEGNSYAYLNGSIEALLLSKTSIPLLSCRVCRLRDEFTYARNNTTEVMLNVYMFDVIKMINNSQPGTWSISCETHPVVDNHFRTIKHILLRHSFHLSDGGSALRLQEPRASLLFNKITLQENNERKIEKGFNSNVPFTDMRKGSFYVRKCHFSLRRLWYLLTLCLSRQPSINV